MTNFEKYIINLKADKKSQHTITAYSKDIEQMLEYVNMSEAEIDLITLIGWKESMSNLSSATIARKITVIKNYLEFLVDIDVIVKNPAKKLKSPKINNKERDYITKEEVVMMIDRAKNPRDKAIAATYLSTGLRASELINLNLSDLDNDKLILKTKGDKDRILFLNEDCKDIISKYLTVRKDGISNLFVSNQGTPMKTEVMTKTLKKLARACGITKDISNHSLRHSFVSTIAEQYGVEVARVAVGHCSLTTTQKYCHTSESTIKSVMLGFTL